jgi:tRNA (guanine37-N1)-methyltransferase
MIEFDIVTIFPEVVEEYIKVGMIQKAQEKDLVKINVHNLRKWTTDKHQSVDDTPCGGGAGMVLKIEPIYKAIKELKRENTIVAITSPKGKKLVQKELKDFSLKQDLHMIILCGRYEGFDQRIHDHLADYEFSIGDYVLSGGELPALILVDGITRLIPGVLGNEESLDEESFNDDQKFDYPQYTRPIEFNGWKVPEVLLTGNHEEIKKWRDSKKLSVKQN